MWRNTIATSCLGSALGFFPMVQTSRTTSASRKNIPSMATMAFPMFFSVRVPSTAWTADLLINLLHVILIFVFALLGYLAACLKNKLTVSYQGFTEIPGNSSKNESRFFRKDSKRVQSCVIDEVPLVSSQSREPAFHTVLAILMDNIFNHQIIA